MTVLDGLIGAMLVALVVSSILFGSLTVQTHSYFTRFPNDPRWIKLMVGVLWVTDLVHQIFTCWAVYDYVVTHFHDPAYLIRNTTPLGTTVTLEPIPAIIVQLYFARRLYLLNKKWWPVVALTVILAVVSFGLGMFCGVIIHTIELLEGFKKYTWAVTSWLVLCCVVDVLIAAAIAIQLWSSRSGFKPTDKLLATLTVWTVNTGMLPAACALLDVVSFVTLNNSLVHLAANITLAKLYGNTALSFLNRRTSEKSAFRSRSRENANIRMRTFPSGGPSFGTATEDAPGATTSSLNPIRRSAKESPAAVFEISRKQFVETHVDTYDTEAPRDMKTDPYSSPEEPSHLSHRSSVERHHAVSESYDLKIQRLDVRS